MKVKKVCNRLQESLHIYDIKPIRKQKQIFIVFMKNEGDFAYLCTTYMCNHTYRNTPWIRKHSLKRI